MTRTSAAATMAARIFDTPLMVDADKAAVIMRAIGHRFTGGDTAPIVEHRAIAEDDPAWEPRSGATVLGDELHASLVESGKGYSLHGNIAVIPVTGTLVRRGAWAGENSGMTSYEGLNAQLRAAVQDNRVAAIALEIDSFGGEAAGIFELGALIREVRAEKPVHAFVADYALSAGYAIASQADTITVPPFGKVGSIGVVMMHVDYSKKLAQDGVKVTLIQSGAHKTEGNPFQALPAKVRDRLQSESDAMWASFAELVAEGRRGKISAADAIKLQAAVLMGEEAVAAGLADRVIEARAGFAELVADMAPAPAQGAAAPSSAQGGVISAAAGARALVGERPAEAITINVAGVASAASAAALAAALREHPTEIEFRGPGRINGASPHIQEEAHMPDPKKPGADDALETKTTAQGAGQEAQGAGAAEPKPEAADPAKIVAKVARAGLPAQFASDLINEGLSLEAATDRIIDAKAKKTDDGGEIENHAPRATVRVDGLDKMKEGMTRALYARTNLDGGEQNEFTGMSLREMARDVLRARGVAIPAGGVNALASAAFVPAMAGGMHSTSDFGNILANVANKAMLKGFGEQPETFDQFTSTGTLSDFKPTKRVGLDAFPTLDEVAEGAEFTFGTIGDMGETVVLATYGKMFAITRQTIINDDLDAFSRVPMKMGRAARRTVGDLVFAILTGNPNMSDGNALFSTAHSNLAGTGAVVSEASVNAGFTAMTTQKDRSKNATALNIVPRFLLAPPSKRAAVMQTLNSEYAPDDSAKSGSSKMPYAYNTTKGIATPIFDARLSGNAWYLLADPALFDTIEVSYLDGISTPFLEQQQGWEVDGTEFKVRIDAAASPLAWEGMYKDPGA